MYSRVPAPARLRRVQGTDAGGTVGIWRITPTNCAKRNHLGPTLIRSLRRDQFYCCIDFSACCVSLLIRSNIRAFSLQGAKCQSLTAAFIVCYCHHVSSNNTAAAQSTVSTSIHNKEVKKKEEENIVLSGSFNCLHRF